jgi:FtsP/CotA-like multicopper oxidase with cupredoxin domain
VDGGLFVLNGVLVNGHGYVNCSSLDDNRDCRDDYANYTVISVEYGEQYLFRMIGSMLALELAITIDNHPFTIIATDGSDTLPTPCQGQPLIVSSGESYDVVFVANQIAEMNTSSNGRYWIRACEPYRCQRLNEWRTIAMIEYTNWDRTSIIHQTTNNNNHQWPDSHAVMAPIFDLMTLQPVPALIPVSPLNATHTITMISKQEWELDGEQYYPSDIPLSMLHERGLDDSYAPKARIRAFPMGATVMIIFNAPMPYTHPMHLHGHYFYLLAIGQPGE